MFDSIFKVSNNLPRFSPNSEFVCTGFFFMLSLYRIFAFKAREKFPAQRKAKSPIGACYDYVGHIVLLPFSIAYGETWRKTSRKDAKAQRTLREERMRNEELKRAKLDSFAC